MAADYNGHHEDEFLHDTRTWKVMSPIEGIVPFNEDRLYHGVLSSLSMSRNDKANRQKTARSICISVCHELDQFFKQTKKEVVEKTSLKDFIAKCFFTYDEYYAGKYFILNKFAR